MDWIFIFISREYSLEAIVVVQAKKKKKKMRLGPQEDSEKWMIFGMYFKSGIVKCFCYIRCGAKEIGGFSNNIQAFDLSYLVDGTKMGKPGKGTVFVSCFWEGCVLG